MVDTGTAQTEQIMVEMIAEARAGKPASAIMTAMLIHSYPEAARRTGISTLYESLLLQSLQSNDPELLACLAEELVIGRRLAADAKMAHRAMEKADDISGFMGSYVIGRMVAGEMPAYAIEKFAKGLKAGHIPSIVWAHQLTAARIPVLGILLRLWFKVADFFVAMKAVLLKDKRRLWRGLDVFGRKNDFVDLIGSDRENPFSRIDALCPGNLPARQTPQ